MEHGSITSLSKSKETRCRSSTSLHWLIYVANHYIIVGYNTNTSKIFNVLSLLWGKINIKLM